MPVQAFVAQDFLAAARFLSPRPARDRAYARRYAQLSQFSISDRPRHAGQLCIVEGASLRDGGVADPETVSSIAVNYRAGFRKTTQ